MILASYLVFLSDERPQNQRLVEVVRQVVTAAHGDDAEVTVIRVTDDDEVAARHRVIATPMILRTLPMPVRRLVGRIHDPIELAEALGYLPEELFPDGVPATGGIKANGGDPNPTDSTTPPSARD